MQQERSNHLIDRIQQAFSRAEHCCDYLYEGSNCVDTKFAIFSYEFSAAQDGIMPLRQDGVWADASAQDDILLMLGKARMVMGIAGLPFLQRQLSLLIAEVQNLS